MINRVTSGYPFDRNPSVFSHVPSHLQVVAISKPIIAVPFFKLSHKSDAPLHAHIESCIVNIYDANKKCIYIYI